MKSSTIALTLLLLSLPAPAHGFFAALLNFILFGVLGLDQIACDAFLDVLPEELVSSCTCSAGITSELAGFVITGAEADTVCNLEENTIVIGGSTATATCTVTLMGSGSIDSFTDSSTPVGGSAEAECTVTGAPAKKITVEVEGDVTIDPPAFTISSCSATATLTDDTTITCMCEGCPGEEGLQIKYDCTGEGVEGLEGLTSNDTCIDLNGIL